MALSLYVCHILLPGCQKKFYLSLKLKSLMTVITSVFVLTFLAIGFLKVQTS